MIDRTDPNSADEVFASLFPDALIRQHCIRAMAESVEAASQAPNTWSITLFQKAVRLNVGRIEALAYFADWVHCIIDSESIPHGLSQRPDVELHIEPNGVLPSVPVSAACNFSANLAGELFSLLRSSHDSLIHTAGRVRGTSFRAAYSPGVTEFLSSATGLHLQHPTHYISATVSIVSPELFEGASRQVTLNIYERNPDARRRCIEHYGCLCSVCSFDFERTYGVLGRDFIHVHHLKPLSEIRQEYIVDPVADLRPICPNCHAMIHRGTEALRIEDLREVVHNHVQVA
jgi:5-methylcytosine-specific restriction protein A